METLFAQYWWLLFPIFGMGMGIFGMYMGHKSRQDRIGLIRQYLEQGKEPPTALLDGLNSDDGMEKTGQKANSGLVSMVCIFSAFALAFGYIGWKQGSDVYFALGLGFAPAALVSLIILIAKMIRKD